MIITSVRYNKKFPYAPYLNEDIGIEATIDEGETPEEALHKLKAMTEKFWKDSNPQIQMGTEVRDIPQEPLSTAEAIIRDIGTCKDLKILESYRLIVKSNPDLQTAYDNKLKEFQP